MHWNNYYQCSNCRGFGGLNPLPHFADPPPLVKIRPGEVEFQPPHLSFDEVGTLLDSHFLLMQFFKYLQRDDWNVIHSFVLAISIEPLQVLCYSEALPTTARILYRSFTPKRTGNCR